MPLVGWVAAAVIGLTIGLLGAGGSILTVPVLVYVAGQPERIAIASALAIVGGIALVGGVTAAGRGLVDGRSVFLFGGPGVVATSAGAHASAWVSGAVQLVVLAVVIVTAALMMLRRAGRPAAAPRAHALALAGRGLAVGLITGFVGVGGGFLIVPALVLLGGLPMRVAVGTSLFIIAINACAGFWTYQATLSASGLSVDWSFIGAFIGVGIAGSALGHIAGGRLDPAKLQRAFAVVLIATAGFILWRQLPPLVGF